MREPTRLKTRKGGLGKKLRQSIPIEVRMQPPWLSHILEEKLAS